MPDDQTYLVAMLEYARLANARVRQLTVAQFHDDVWHQFGLARVLQIIGEAARHVSEPSRSRYSQLPWTQIVGMRHLLVHEYFRVDPKIIWDTATQSIPDLLAALEPEIGPVLDKAAQERKHE